MEQTHNHEWMMLAMKNGHRVAGPYNVYLKGVRSYYSCVTCGRRVYVGGRGIYGSMLAEPCS